MTVYRLNILIKDKLEWQAGQMRGDLQVNTRHYRKWVHVGKAVSALAPTWKICSRISGKRLHAFLR